MTEAEKLIQTLQMTAPPPPPGPLPGVVTKVDGNACTVQLVDSDMEVSDVLLTAAADDDKGWVVYPAVGSAVVVSAVGNDENRLYITQYTKVDKIEGTIDTCKLTMDKAGFVFEREEKNLMDVIAQLIDELNKIIVVQGTSINVPAMQAIKDDFKKILKGM